MSPDTPCLVLTVPFGQESREITEPMSFPAGLCSLFFLAHGFDPLHLTRQVREQKLPVDRSPRHVQPSRRLPGSPAHYRAGAG